MRPRIAIVNSSSFGKLFPEHLERLNKFAEVRRLTVSPNITASELIPELINIHGIITSLSPRYPSEVLRALPKLVAISRHGIGYDNIDVKAATLCGICVSRVPGIVEREAVAEHALSLMLAVSRQLVQAREAVLRNQWNQRAQFIGIELKGKRIGLIGLGNVGKRVANILVNGFGAEVVAFDPFVPQEDFTNCQAKRVTFEELLTTCSVISLHCSLNESNLKCFSEKEFSMMKKGVILINTSRAELIDEKALEDALNKGYVGAYGSDVAEGAPLNFNSTLAKRSNVIIVPHLGAYTLESLRGMGDTTVNDMESIFVRGVFPDTIVDRTITTMGIKQYM
jgi:lactate dehydrogenase-like 2-hydroxyacid dehydrogenase